VNPAAVKSVNDRQACSQSLTADQLGLNLFSQG
jgi:hypothetical protein